LTERNQQKHPQTIFLHITAKQISKKFSIYYNTIVLKTLISHSQPHTMARIPQRNMNITI
jgi:hypothetical protein